MKKLLIIALLVAGCGQNHTPVFQITGFETYYNTFVSQTNKSTNDIIIQFGNVDAIMGSSPSSDYVGVCQQASNMTGKVTLDQNFWSSASEDERQELLDHELGHCILNRVHRTDFLPNGVPASIMNPYLFNPAIIKANSQYYYNELVND